jgi:hypothetical protein
MIRPPARRLRFHDAEGFLVQRNGPGEVHRNDRLPLLDREVLEVDRSGRSMPRC